MIDTFKRWLGLSDETRSAPAPDDDFWYSDLVFGLTGKSSLQSTAVYSCVRVIAETIGSLPCMVYERSADGQRVIAREHPLYRVVHDSPNDYQTANEYWETVATHIMGTGNSYSRVRYDSRMNASVLLPIDPAHVRVMVDQRTGVKAFEISESGRKELLFDGDILHIPGLSYDGVVGYSPLQAARRAAEMGMRAEKHADSVFRNHAIPPAVVELTGGMDPSAMQAFAKSWQSKYSGDNVGKIGFIQNGTLKSVPVNHRDLQFLELRKFQLEEIARVYRVPLHLIQSLDRSTNNNIEHQSLDFVIHTIRPWVVRLEKRINMTLLGPQERQRYYAEWNVDALMRGDAASRAAFYQSGIQNGWLMPDEARAKENLNPQGGAAGRLYIQGATVPLESAGVPAPPQ